MRAVRAGQGARARLARRGGTCAPHNNAGIGHWAAACSLTHAARCAILIAEVAALLDLKANPGNELVPELEEWSKESCPCNASLPSKWGGVKCTDGRVTEM